MAFLDFRPRADGSTAYRVKYRLEGKERVLTLAGEEQARQWCDVANRAGVPAALKLLEPEEPESSCPTVGDLIDMHVASLTRVERGTREDYRRHAAADIKPYLGHIPGDRLRRKHVIEWVQTLSGERGLSGKTITNRHSLLSAALTTAVQDEDVPITVNPCRGVAMPKSTAEEMVFLEPWEFTLVQAHIAAPWRRLTTTLVGSGVRWSEATALQAGDVELSRSTLHVRRAWKHARGERPYLGEPKANSRRPVRFGDVVEEALLPLVAGKRREELVFTSRRGGVVLNNSFHSRVWQPAVAAAMTLGTPPAGVLAGTPEYRQWARDVKPAQVDRAALLQKRPRVHDLRHTYAAWSLNAGVSIYALSRAMGHNSIKVTVDRYGHLSPEGLEGPALAADAALILARG
jgi:integrase